MMTRVAFAVSRDYEPVPSQWYENVEEEESFRVLSVDEDSELIEIEYLDGDIEEIDLETWHEMDLERIEEPEGWSESDDEDADEDEEDDEDEDDWDDDDDDDDDEDEDEVDDERDEY
jgi:TATA-binding protein-associated factor Taf7